MQKNKTPKMSLKALQERQRMASSQAGAKVCGNVFKENDILRQNTSRRIMPYYIFVSYSARMK